MKLLKYLSSRRIKPAFTSIKLLFDSQHFLPEFSVYLIEINKTVKSIKHLFKVDNCVSQLCKLNYHNLNSLALFDLAYYD